MPAPGRRCVGCNAPLSARVQKYAGFYACRGCKRLARGVMRRAAEVLNRPPPRQAGGSPGVFLFPTTAVGVPR